MAYKKQIHKMKKGEDLAGIAKKYKHKNLKTIWEAPENKKLVSKRKKPDQIEPGDVLTIPFNVAQWAEITAEVDDWQAMMAADTSFIDSFEASRTKSETTIKRMKADIVTDEQWLKAYVGGVAKYTAEAKKWATGVDAVATVTQMMLNLGKMVKQGHKAAKAASRELAKINAALAKEAANMAYSPIAKEARKAAAKHVQNQKNEYSHAIASLGIISDSFDKMTSPSFWAWTAAHMADGKSWSEASSSDFIKESKQQTASMTRYIAKNQAERRKTIAKMEALIKNITAERKNALGRIADAKKNLKELEKLF